MKLCNCVINVSRDPRSGSPLCQVPKFGVTENELTLLRGIHGSANVIKAEECGEIDREQRDDLLKLARAYGDSNELEPVTGPALIKKHFGIDLFEFEQWLTDALDSEERERDRKQSEREDVERALRGAPVAAPAAPVAVDPGTLAVAEAAVKAVRESKVAKAAATADLD